MIIEIFHVRSDANCLRNRTALLLGDGVHARHNDLDTENNIFSQFFVDIPGTLDDYCTYKTVTSIWP